MADKKEITTDNIVAHFGFTETSAKRYLRQLTEFGYLEAHGGNKNDRRSNASYICFKNIAQATDQKVEYSKHKGLADKKCEALLLESLKDHGSLTKKEIVRLLWDVLPDQLEDKQKINKIDYILKRLCTAAKIHNKTNGSDSVWSLGKL